MPALSPSTAADTPATRPSGRPARRKQARPGELLAAALDLFVEKGYAATRVEEVAQRAGVSKGTLFLYFSSKEELFKAVVRTNISDRFQEWRVELDAYEGPSSDLLRHAVRTWWARVGDTQASGISKLIMSEASNFPEIADFYRQEVILPGTQLLRDILARGVRRGEFRPVDARYGVFTVLAPMMFMVLWKHSFGTCASDAELVPEHYFDTQLDILLHGLCTTAPRSGDAAGQP